MNPWFWVVNQNYLNLIANETSSGFGLSIKVQKHELRAIVYAKKT
jgi:hypothetical protein